MPLAAAAGLTLSAAVSVKLFAVVAAVPAAAMILAARPSKRSLAAIAGGLATVPLLLAAAHWGELGALYDDVVRFHTSARDEAAGLNTERVVRFFAARSAWTWLVAAGALIWIVRRGHPRLVFPLWLWALASAAFLVWHRPLLDHHFVLVAAACSVPAGAVLGNAAETSRRTAVATVVLVAGGRRGRGTAMASHRTAARPGPRCRGGGGCGSRRHRARRDDRLRPAARRLSRRPAATGRARRHVGGPLRIRLARRRVRPVGNGRGRCTHRGRRPHVQGSSPPALGVPCTVPGPPRHRRNHSLRAFSSRCSSSATRCARIVL